MGTPWPQPAPQIHRLMVFNIWSHSNILKLENFTLKKKKVFWLLKEKQEKGRPGQAQLPLELYPVLFRAPLIPPSRKSETSQTSAAIYLESAPLFSFYLAVLCYRSTLSIIWICTLCPSRVYWKSPLRVQQGKRDYKDGQMPSSQKFNQKC